MAALEREIGSAEEGDQYEDKWADLYEDEDESAEEAEEKNKDEE